MLLPNAGQVAQSVPFQPYPESQTQVLSEQIPLALAPHGAPPLAGSAPTSTHVWSPVAQEYAPRSQGFDTGHAPPATHDVQVAE